MKTAILLSVLGLSVLLALTSGGLPLSALDAAVLGLRARRVASGLVVGAGLSLSGVAMQCLLQNPLADPFLLGMSGGASLGAVAVVVLLGVGAWVGPAAALGALGAAALVATVARSHGALLPPTRLILAGVAAAAMMGALTTLLLQLVPREGVLRATLFWTAGSLGATPTLWTGIAAAAVLGSIAWLRLRAGWMDRMLLGEETARSLGVPTARFRVSLLGIAAVLTGACVAVGGLIGFVGLVGPHLARLLWGPGHARLVPRAALMGALVLVPADWLARTALYPRELSVGVLTALLGGPLFLALLRQRSYAFGGSP